MKLRTDSIKKSYKGRQVVKGVSVEVNQGEIVGLLGPNGAGKTTSFYMIVGLVRPNSGTVYLDDLDITRHAMYKRAQLGIGYLPQEVSVFRKMSVEDNIMTVLEMTDLDKEARHAKLESLLDEFGLNHVRKNLGQSLSGGEKRRTEIARALATDPKFILLDEPFAGVDPIAVEDIQRIVHKLKKRNIGVLITDHNVQETLSITDRTYLLFEGSILREGSAESLAADEMVRKVYLGENFVLRPKNEFDEVAEELDEQDLKNIQNSISGDVDDISTVAEKLLRNLEEKNNLDEMKMNLRLFTEKLKALKSLYSKNELPPNCSTILSKIQFEEAERFEKGLRTQSKLMILLLIPVYGWIMYFVYKFRMEECSRAIQTLLSELRVLSNELKFKGL